MLRFGLDLGGTTLNAALVEPSGKVVGARSILAPRHPNWLAGAIEELYSLICDAGGVSPSEIGVIGLGLPGLVDGDGTVLSSPHQPQLIGKNLTSVLERFGAKRVKIDNDVNCAARAVINEGFTSFCLITLGTGIGGAYVNDGHLVGSPRLWGGEYGHMTIVVGGERCACGKRGCAEMYASGNYLRSEIFKAFASDQLSDLFDSMPAVDSEVIEKVLSSARWHPRCKSILNSFSYHLAVVISNLVEVMDPERFFIGGGVSNSFHYFENEVIAAYESIMANGRLREKVPIERVVGGQFAGAIGAALV
ncbi:MAG: ROK family protein [Actinomycetota bacterium]|nr:ROK family protein [Actinomycetota bacterium]